jgi:single-strand DNA-binding protein
MNEVSLVGRTTKAIELKMTTKNTEFVNFTLAVYDTFTKGADFINIVAWKATAKYIAKYAKKGELLSVNGSLKTRTYTKDNGETIYITEVIARQIQILKTSGGSGEKKEAEVEEETYEIETDDVPF